jgi:hypothetical protein
VIGVDHQRGSVGLASWMSGQQQGRLAVKLRQEALGGAVEARFGVAGESDPEIGVNREDAGTEIYLGRLRHQAQWLGRLRIGL